MNKRLAWMLTIFLSCYGFSLNAAQESNRNLITGSSVAQSSDNMSSTRNTKIYFKNATQFQNTFILTGVAPEKQIEFRLRKNEIASKAELHIDFTPSPSLLPIISQLKIYLNDELMDVISVTKEQLGKSNLLSVTIDPLYLRDFNRLQLKFIGHYTSICENPANSTLWINVSQSSYLDLTVQTLKTKNDLSHFPEPFFDPVDVSALKLQMVFSEQPSVTQQRAGAILASWFGSLSLWRGHSFSTLFEQAPQGNAIVFATNSKYPAFLKNYQKAEKPTIELLDNPSNPYTKILLISGRDDNDLVTAVKGIAQGTILFRGQRLEIDKVDTLAPRKPYDAPNWLSNEHPTKFAQLLQYQYQLQTSGVQPYAVWLNFTLPPDLFLKHSRGIEVNLKYRYSAPSPINISHLNINLNNYFVQNYTLEPENSITSKLPKLSILGNVKEAERTFYIPVMDMGTHNQFNFDFQYSLIIGGGDADGNCITQTLVNNYAAIDGDSTIDISNYRHYIKMPNLKAFAKGGFPFSRLADLSETWILVKKQVQPVEVTTLLNTAANISASTGYPILAVSLTNDWSKVKDLDTDLLIIGSLPKDLKKDNQMNLLIDKSQSWVKEPFRHESLFAPQYKKTDMNAVTKVEESSQGPMAAIIGAQSPYYKQRSIIALLADSHEGFKLINNTLTNKKALDKIQGTVTVIRDSGVKSMLVGNSYHVGHLPWWIRIWYAVQHYPLGLGIASVLAAIIATIVLWKGLKAIGQRRLNIGDED